MTHKDQLEISDAVKDLVKDAKGMSERQLAAAIQDLINTAAEQTAGNLYRGEQRYMRDDIYGDTRTPEQKQPGPNYIPIGGAGNGA
jgi:hypothetical protein